MEAGGSLAGPMGLTHRIVALSCAPGLRASNLAQGRTSTRVSQLLVSPARALLENPSAAGNLGRALIGVLITGRSALPPFPQPLSRPPGPSSLFAASTWGSTRYSRTRLQARPGERSSLPAAGRARARSPAPASRGHWACAARGRRWLGAAERASGRAHPDFIGCGGRGGVAERWVRAGLAREIAARRLGADRGAAARGGRGGRRPARSEAFPLATSCLVWARGASGETRGPEGGSEVRAPRRKAPAGLRRLELSLGFQNPPLCAWVERGQAPRPPAFTLTAFNWCREPGVRVRAPVQPPREPGSALRRPPGAARRSAGSGQGGQRRGTVPQSSFPVT